MKKNPAKLLLEWFDANGRDLPWRVKGGAHDNPYAVLVSELMLQQTTVKTVIPYFHRFMERFPTVDCLAAATEEEVYQYWQGLGYYSRARSLLKTAQMIVQEFGGVFPQTKMELLKLKGIGAYTAASILSLAFNEPETVVDGNVQRIMCRMYHLTQPVEEIKEEIYTKAAALTDQQHAADYASAIMDLGAVICTPKKPQCLLCPWQTLCLSCGREDVEQIPYKKKLPKKEKRANVYVLFNQAGEVYIRKRTEKGLLSGLYEFPWSEENLYVNAEDSGQEVTHVFTHFKLVLHLYKVQNATPRGDGFFVAPKLLDNYPFSTLMRKVIEKL